MTSIDREILTYWHCKIDFKQNGKGLDFCDGSPHWRKSDYFSEKSTISHYGEFRPESVKLYWDKEQHLPKLDFFGYNSFEFSCSQRVYGILEELVGPWSKKYPLKIDNEQYIIFRQSEFLDIFDAGQSTFRTLPSGTRTGFKNIHLAKNPPSAIPVFGLAGELGLNMTTIVSDEFKKIYEENNFTGLRFEKVIVS